MLGGREISENSKLKVKNINDRDQTVTQEFTYQNGGFVETENGFSHVDANNDYSNGGYYTVTANVNVEDDSIIVQYTHRSKPAYNIAATFNTNDNSYSTEGSVHAGSITSVEIDGVDILERLKEVKTVAVGGVELQIADGDTWAQIAERNSDKIFIRDNGTGLAVMKKPAEGEEQYLSNNGNTVYGTTVYSETAGNNFAWANNTSATQQESQEDSQEQNESTNPYANNQVGDVVSFGQYNWYIIGKSGDSVTLLMKDKLGSTMPYNNASQAVTWASCSLRTYLNETFYNTFDNDDKAKIVKTHNSNPNNSTYNMTGGNATDDYIYLLSIEEASSLTTTIRNNGNFWWLRSPGQYNNYAAAVGHSISADTVNYGGFAVTEALNVRPALTLDYSQKATVTFDHGTGSGTMDPATVEVGTEYTLPSPNGFTAPGGKKFAGWKIGDATTIYSAGEQITVNEDTTLKAVWVTHNSLQAGTVIKLGDTVYVGSVTFNPGRYSFDKTDGVITLCKSAENNSVMYYEFISESGRVENTLREVKFNPITDGVWINTVTAPVNGAYPLAEHYK
jgi:hypothetical protein